MGAEVVDHVKMPSLLQFVARLSEGFLSDLSHLFAGEYDFVAFVGALNHLQDICVVRRIGKSFWTVNIAFNLQTKGKENSKDQKESK